jgi:aminobenzoyl-glutamate utilization protein A
MEMSGTDPPIDVELLAEAAAWEANVRAWRRELHRYPEPGFGEFRTAIFISEHLRNLGWTVRIAEDAMDSAAVLSRDDVRIEHSFQRAAAAGIDLDVLQRLRTHGTAVVADLHFGDGPVIGLRVDIDGLPITETTVPDHRPVVDGYRSDADDEMHACGHDGHVAIGLGVASILTRLGSRLRGTVRLIFQPAEEGALGGAAAIAARGIADDLDAILSFHLGLGVPTGTFVTHGTLMATSKFRITFRGHPSHPVLAPHEGRNALLAASSAALALHAIAPHPDGWFNLNVGVLRSGESQGVTPERAVLELGVWTTSSNVHSYLKARVSEIAAGVAATWQVEAEIRHIGDAPLADHDETLGLIARDVAHATPGIDTVVDALELSAADDATVFLERVSAHGGRGIYSVIGSDLADGHHTPAFDFDEASLLHGTTVVSGIISSLLR